MFRTEYCYYHDSIIRFEKQATVAALILRFASQPKGKPIAQHKMFEIPLKLYGKIKDDLKKLSVEIKKKYHGEKTSYKDIEEIKQNYLKFLSSNQATILHVPPKEPDNYIPLNPK
jgi:hypothetical protein